jgi:hypothetical protein
MKKIRPLNEEHPDWVKVISKMAREASIKARKEAFKLGLKIMYAYKGNLYYEHPNGKIEFIKKIK